jgi:putative FmdB family regulatory protein
MPIYEYLCEDCGKHSSALLSSFSSPDPVCPHCGKPALHRLVSNFATARSGESEGGDFAEGHEHDHGEFGGGDDFGGGEDFGAGGDFGDDDY